MVEKTTNMSPTELSLEQRKAIITSYPLFCLLNPNDVNKLATLTKETSFEPGAIIAKEGDVVDTVYLIVSGTAEVSRTIITVAKAEVMHIAVLVKGDAIGLAEAGFFSHSGIRTATVTATSTMKLLSLNIKDFDAFLKTPGVTYPALKNIGEKILLMNFLKQTNLFQRLPNDKIKQLANHVKRVLVNAGETIFKEGEIADICYFILSGKVEIVAASHNKEHILKVLDSFTMFGEGAFLDSGKRNASAIAKTNCELFAISHDDFHSLISIDEVIAKNLNLSRIEQIRPIPQPGVLIQNKTSVEGNLMTILKIKDKQDEIILSKQEEDIWKNLDGHTSLIDILEKMQNKPTIYDLYTFVVNLNKAGFLEIPSIEIVVHAKPSSIFHQLTSRIKSLWK